MPRILLILVILAMATPVWSQSADLSWEAVTLDVNDQPETILGYHVDYGTTENGPYPLGFSTGDVDNVRVDDLVNGEHYYFVVKAIDTSLNESAYSNQADYVVPNEICNNLQDDDHDGLIDCQDVECPDNPEDCDGFDNDCDGTTDNNLSAEACPLQDGVCAGSSEECVQGDWQDCDDNSYGPYYEPVDEFSCDGRDNDCDDAVDEDLDAPLCQQQLGVCQGSLRPCNGSSGWGICDADDYGANYEATETRCDGLDNDCDDSVDEDLTGQPCLLDVGVCAGSSEECVQGDWQDCDDDSYGTDYEPGEESSCDGLDNDCDNAVDEDLDAPLCQRQFGVCQGSLRPCNGSSGWGVCDADDYGANYEATETRCDGLDNDCDDSVDEDLTGQPCLLDVGVCAGSSEECVQGNWQDCDDDSYGLDYEPGAESTCDGRDNDCDGAVDEDLDAPLCQRQFGVCQGSLRPCNGSSGWGVCDADDYGASYQDNETLCDGLDNDCDAITDEDCPCIQGEIIDCSSNEGVCVAGTQECDENGEWGECSGVLPSTEECDGLDNDCNAVVDDLEGPACLLQDGVCAGSTQPCGGAAGFLPCDSDSYGPNYELDETICDGLDNDCDDSTDEDLTGTLCPFQMGVCADSRQTCDGLAGWKECDAGSYGSDYEVDETKCDGFDNDCDGSTDEDLIGPNCILQDGVCNGSVQRCVDQGWLPCDATDYGPNYEVVETLCDALDNDCDGETDQDLNPPACILQLGVCAGSRRPCQGAQGFGDCDASDYGAGYQDNETLCDGLDNDCDAITDEDCPCIQGETNPCSLDEGECQAGVQECDQDGYWGECSGVLPTDEECDGLDNNCNGSTDENLTGSSCPLQEGVCAGAVQACRGTAGWQCDAEAYGAGYELEETNCDDLDNDCDGQTDENLTGSSCPLQEGVCAGAVQACRGAAGWQCDTEAYGASYELEETSCDDLDNDCDGQTDENDCGPVNDSPKVKGGFSCVSSPGSFAWFSLLLFALIWFGRRRRQV